MPWRPNRYGKGAKDEPGSLYLIHFAQPYRHAQHYLGFAHEGLLEERIEAHRNNTGARLIRVINAAGITWQVVRIWHESSRKHERRLKNRGGMKKHCPVCKSSKGEE